MAGDEALAAGLALAREIAAAGIWHEEFCAFHGAVAAPRLGEAAHWGVLGGDYYEGSAGIARLLALAAEMGAGAEVARAAKGAARHGLARARGWSLMGGLLGAGLVAMDVGDRLRNPELAEAGWAAVTAAVADALAEAEAGTAPLDLLAGLAGVLHAVVCLAASDPDFWLPVAKDLGLHLAEAGCDMDIGRAWPMLPGDPVPLCGLAHGAAGVALAFSELAALDPKTLRWSEEADAARLFERMHFDATRQSWFDLRPDCQPADGGPPPAPHFWCHGSVGIAFDRLAALRTRPDCPVLGAETAAALMGARSEAARILAGPAGPGGGYLGNGSLCHGLSGMIDLLAETGEASDRALIVHIAAFVRNDSRRAGGWRCGILTGEPTPALMTGLAGIAWGQLRAARPETVPAGWDPASALGRQPSPRAADGSGPYPTRIAASLADWRSNSRR